MELFLQFTEDKHLVDWFVRCDCKERNTTVRGIHIYAAYRNTLKEWGKKQFDAFARGNRIDLVIGPGRITKTTKGQMNFFYWMKMLGAYQYILDNRRIIEDRCWRRCQRHLPNLEATES